MTEPLSELFFMKYNGIKKATGEGMTLDNRRGKRPILIYRYKSLRKYFPIAHR